MTFPCRWLTPLSVRYNVVNDLDAVGFGDFVDTVGGMPQYDTWPFTAK